MSLCLILYGLTAPFAAALMDRFGVRRVVAWALGVVGISSLATTIMTSPWQLWLLWGVCIGIGTGAMALVFGAIVANRWFEQRRGLITGLFSAANATGQLIFLPFIAAAAAGPGWRWAAGLVGVLALVSVPLVLWKLIDYPHQVGLLPFGATEAPPVSEATVKPVALALQTLRMASGSWVFWALVLTFFICGWSTNGLIQTHFVPAAHDHGMPQTTAAGLLALVGAFDIAGTLASGWLTDRYDSRILLTVYYGFRGLSLLILPGLLGPTVTTPMWSFIVFYGLDWVATVPPTVALCRQHFGLERSGVVFGWVFASHMVGAGISAAAAGWIRTTQGDYRVAWLVAGALCLAAAACILTLPARAQTGSCSGTDYGLAHQASSGRVIKAPSSASIAARLAAALGAT